MASGIFKNEGFKPGTNLIKADPRAIRVEAGHNPRDFSTVEAVAHLENLKESIRVNGVLEPVLVRKDGENVFLVDGESRLRAALALIADGVDIQTIPAIEVRGGNPAERLVMALAANTSQPLSKVEYGNAFRRLEAYGYTNEQIAERCVKNDRYVREALELSDAPVEVQTMVKAGEVSPALALKTVRAHGSGSVAVLTKAVTSAKAQGRKAAVREKNHQLTAFETVALAVAKELEEDVTNAGSTDEWAGVSLKTARRLVNLATEMGLL